MNINKYTRSEILNFNSREYAPDRKDLDKKCDLSLNINPCDVSERVILKLESIDSKKLSHYYLENKELLNEIASYVKANPEQIMLGDGCDGCRHIEFFAMGPDFKENYTTTTPYEQIDISLTIGELMGFAVPTSN